MRRRHLMMIMLVIAGLATLSVPAMAREGQRTSYMSYAPPGFKSQSWYDAHIDDWSTDITFENCTESYRPLLAVNATIELRYERSLLPDVSKGSRTLNCYNAFFTGHWGEMTDVGYYHFNLTHINGYNSGLWLDVYRVYFSW